MVARRNSTNRPGGGRITRFRVAGVVATVVLASGIGFAVDHAYAHPSGSAHLAPRQSGPQLAAVASIAIPRLYFTTVFTAGGAVWVFGVTTRGSCVLERFDEAPFRALRSTTTNCGYRWLSPDVPDLTTAVPAQVGLGRPSFDVQQRMVAVNRATGELEFGRALWSTDFPTANHSATVYGDGSLYVGGTNLGVSAPLKIRQYSARSGRLERTLTLLPGEIQNYGLVADSEGLFATPGNTIGFDTKVPPLLFAAPGSTVFEPVLASSVVGVLWVIPDGKETLVGVSERGRDEILRLAGARAHEVSAWPLRYTDRSAVAVNLDVVGDATSGLWAAGVDYPTGSAPSNGTICNSERLRLSRLDPKTGVVREVGLMPPGLMGLDAGSCLDFSLSRGQAVAAKDALYVLLDAAANASLSGPRLYRVALPGHR